MKYFIRHFSLLIVFFILVFGFVIKFHNYEEQKELEYIKIGKYTFDKNYTFTVNDSLIKNKTISEYNDILFKIIKLHKNSKIEVNKMEKIITLSEFIMKRQTEHKNATGELSRLLNSIVIAAKIISNDVRRAGLMENFLGKEGNVNIQGEEQQRLDVIADEQFIKMLRNGGEVCAIASEENDDFVAFDDEVSKHGKYVVLFDPLDGHGPNGTF